MGFFKIDEISKKTSQKQLCSGFGCKLCPAYKGEQSKGAPVGDSRPDVYILLEHSEAYLGCRFPYLEIIDNILDSYSVRVGYLALCGAQTDNQVYDCCHNNLYDDICNSKPKIIIGIGQWSLQNILGLCNIGEYRGRFFPVEIKKHSCWFVGVSSPRFISSTLRYNNTINEHTDTFEKDIQQVVSFLETQHKPVVEDVGILQNNIEINFGATKKEITQIEKQLCWYAEQNYIAIDIETNCLKPYEERAQWLSVAVSSGDRTFAFLYNHPTQPQDNQKLLYSIVDKFLNSTNYKICHNLVFELQWFDRYYGKNPLFNSNWHDTMAQAYIIDERQGSLKGQHPLSLDMLIYQYFGFRLKDQSDVDRGNLISACTTDVLLYNGLDAKYTFKLFEKQQNRLQEEGLMFCYEEQVWSARTLAITQNLGVAINWDRWEEVKNQYQFKFDKVKQRLFNLGCMQEFQKNHSRPLNPDADRDVADLLSNVLNIRLTKRTKRSGQLAVGKDVLQGLVERGYEFPKLLIEYRFLNNMLKKYILSIPGYVKHDGKLHTNYNNLLTRTGRLASSDPDMQNFPKRQDEQIRSFVVIEPYGGYYSAEGYK